MSLIIFLSGFLGVQTVLFLLLLKVQGDGMKICVLFCSNRTFSIRLLLNAILFALSRSPLTHQSL